MRTEAEIAADAVQQPAFSNSTSFEIWAAANCGRSSGCVRDDAWGNGVEGSTCPLINVAIGHQWTPREWLHGDDDSDPGECTEFEEVVAHATDDEPADENPDAAYEEPTWRPVETLKGQEGLF